MSKLEELIQELCPNGVEFKNIGCFCEIKTGRGITHKDTVTDGQYPVISGGLEPMGFYNEYNREAGTVTIARAGSAGYVNFIETKFYLNDKCFSIIPIEMTNSKFLYYALKNIENVIISMQSTGSVPTVNIEKVSSIRIPIPPLDVQNEIVRILDNFTLLTAEFTAELTVELTTRKEQYDYYFKKILSLKETDYATMPLKNIGKVCMCRRIMKHQTASTGDVPFYKIGTFGKNPDSFISKSLFEEYKKNYSYPKKGDVLISCSGTIGRTVIFDGNDAYFQDSNIVWIDNDESIALNKYLFYVYKLNPFIISTGGTIPRLYNSGIENAEIKVPSIEKQKEIILMLDKFEVCFNGITQSLLAEIELRKQQYEYYRNKLLTFKELK